MLCRPKSPLCKNRLWVARLSSEAVNIRMNELQALLVALSTHSVLAKEIQLWLDRDLARLIDSNNEETRGRVKLLLELLNWPVAVHEEIRNLQQELP